MVVNIAPDARHFLLQDADVFDTFIVVEEFFPFESFYFEVAHDQNDEFWHEGVLLNFLLGYLDPPLDLFFVVFDVLLKQWLKEALLSRQ